MMTKRQALDALNRVLEPTGFSLQRRKRDRTMVDTGHPMTRALSAAACFEGDPTTLVDVGCSGGIDERWRAFGRQLRGWGIDAMTEECARLTAMETNPQIRYIDARIGVAGDHPVLRGRTGGTHPRRNPWNRLSVELANTIRRRQNRTRDEAIRASQWQEQALSENFLTVDDLMEAQKIANLDFLKIDLDGPDYEVLSGFVPYLTRFQTLGIKVEVFFFGTDEEDTHSFHNTDRLLRRHGFELFGLSTQNYSMAALPAGFTTGEIGPTSFGRVLWGDAVYFRDPAGESKPPGLSATKLLKLACMFEVFGLPDCAAEILVRFGETIGRKDGAQLLDLLVPRLDGVKLSYKEYLARFDADPRSFI